MRVQDISECSVETVKLDLKDLINKAVFKKTGKEKREIKY